jgi:hypothetical protein
MLVGEPMSAEPPAMGHERGRDCIVAGRNLDFVE